MKRLLALAASALLLAGCGGAAAVMTPTGTAEAALSPHPPMLPIEVSVLPPMDIIDMPELDVTAYADRMEIQERMAPQDEARFFYVIPVSLDEAPQLPPPPCPTCLR